MSDDTAAAFSLLNAAAVRTRAERMLALALDDKLPNFRVDLSRLDEAADLVAATTRMNYPSLDVPFHSRWRHFVISGGQDRWPRISRMRSFDVCLIEHARARAEFDLAIVSVLLDAGAGPALAISRSRSAARALGRSEGLAIASLTMFGNGDFSAASDPRNQEARFRADGSALGAVLTRGPLRQEISGRGKQSASRP